jgi:polysaccharide deacetylase 2 family uncharacterized protein YibQ
MTGSSGANRFYLGAFILLVARICWSEPGSDGDVTIETIPLDRVRIAVIIDDLGHVSRLADRVIALNGPVACAILPHTPYAGSIARQAHAAGKEVMLHLPLQAVAEYEATGLGTIKIDTTQAQLLRIFKSDIASIPHVVGVNNHMGSLLTQHPGHMNWLMGALKSRGDLFFVDSYTTEASVALQIAREHGLPSTRRDVFLDNVQTHTAIDKEFQRLKRLARKRGSAVAIGHPYPVTLSYLESALPGLANEGIDLVSIGELVREKRNAINVELAQN